MYLLEEEEVMNEFGKKYWRGVGEGRGKGGNNVNIVLTYKILKKFKI